MANKFITNICGGVSRSNVRKVGLGDSLNMYSEFKDEREQAFSIIMRSIKGTETYCSPVGECRGMFKASRCFNGEGVAESPKVYGVWGDTLYLVERDSATAIGKLATTSGTCRFCETGGYGSAHPHLVIVDGINVYAVNTGVSVASQQTEWLDHGRIKLPLRVNSTDTFISPTHCAYLYGYLVVNDAGTDAFYTSYQFPFETYKPTDPEYYDLFRVNTTTFKDYGFITYSEWQPDNTLALIGNGSRLFTFGDKSYQVFQYNNDVNNPFNSPDTASKNIGIKATDSLCGIGDMVCWLGSSDMGDNAVWVNTGSVESQKVSTIEIEELIASLPFTRDAVGQMWKEGQHVFYALSFPSGNVTIVYDFLTKMWHKRGSLGAKNEMNVWRYRYATMNEDGDILFADNDVCVLQSDSKWTEHDGRAIVRKRVGGVIYSDHLNFVCDWIQLVTNNGQSNSILEDAQCTMRYSWDGATFSDLETATMGKIGQYDYETIWYNLGYGRYLTIEISCTEDCPFALMGINFGGEAMEW
jgi:hypothetical protein